MGSNVFGDIYFWLGHIIYEDGTHIHIYIVRIIHNIGILKALYKISKGITWYVELYEVICVSRTKKKTLFEKQINLIKLSY